MLDIKDVKNRKDYYKKCFAKREYEVDLDKMLALYDKANKLKQEEEVLLAQKNKGAKEFELAKRNGQDVTALQEKLRENTRRAAELTKEHNETLEEFNKLYFALPNIVTENTPAGGKENNLVLREFKKSQPSILSQKHIYILKYDCGFGAGQFPKFANEDYFIDKKFLPNNFLLPTAETALVNLHRGEILKEEELPKKYFAYTPCFRIEAGSNRPEEKGMIRGHQFNKVEMVEYVLPEDNERAWNELLGKAERIVQKLGLHYRLVQLAGGDYAHGMAQTWDIEIYIPSMNRYTEVSSISTAFDYQARRTNTRVLRKDGKKDYVFTLNASGIATSRIFPAILEQYQNPGGTVTVPNVLVPYLGCKVLK